MVRSHFVHWSGMFLAGSMRWIICNQKLEGWTRWQGENLTKPIKRYWALASEHLSVWMICYHADCRDCYQRHSPGNWHPRTIPFFTKHWLGCRLDCAHFDELCMVCVRTRFLCSQLLLQYVWPCRHLIQKPLNWPGEEGPAPKQRPMHRGVWEASSRCTHHSLPCLPRPAGKEAAQSRA